MKKIAFDEGLLARVPKPALAAGVLVIIIALAALLFGGGYNREMSDGDNEAWAQAYEPMARKMAKSVADALKPYSTALNAIAINKDVSKALVDNESSSLEALAQQLTPNLPGVLRLRLLPSDVRDPQPDADPPLSFASISMLRRARENATTPDAEVHMAGSDSQHLVFIRRIESLASAESEAALLGFAHLSVSPDIASQALLAAPPTGVFAELKQGVKVQLAATGRAAQAGAVSTLARVPGTSLSIKFSAPGSAASAGDSAGGNGLLWLAGAAVLALIGVAAFYSRQKEGVTVGKSASDTVIYQGAIKAILDGVHPGLEQLLPGARLATTDTDFGLGGLDERAQGDDITTFSVPAGDAQDDPTIPRADDLPDSPPPPIEVSITEAVAASVFHVSDMGGAVDDTFNEEAVYQIGRAIGAEADALNQKTVVVARDGRNSSELLLEALIKGLLESGRDVLDIGLAPTPVLYFATNYLDARSGVMITGSHKDADYNGLIVVLDGTTWTQSGIGNIKRRVDEQDFFEGTGSVEETDIVAEYIRRISEDIPVTLGNALKVVVDCGNGVPGTVAPDILRAIGHDVTELYCEVDGDFPNHKPDPAQPDNLQALIEAVADEGADLGLAFDGDGDRLGVVDGEGNIVWPDRQLILFARDILSRNPGAKIIYDIECSRVLESEILASGGEPVMSAGGHSLIKEKMAETGALLAGEMSGHVFFKERWYGFDDALYSAARLLEILINSGQTAAEVFAALPRSVVTAPLIAHLGLEDHAAYMEKVYAAAQFDGAEVSTQGGLRVNFGNAMGVVRPAHSSAALVFRFEGDDQEAVSAAQEQFRSLLSAIEPKVELPF